jgi:hypothetical protein
MSVQPAEVFYDLLRAHQPMGLLPEITCAGSVCPLNNSLDQACRTAGAGGQKNSMKLSTRERDKRIAIAENMNLMALLTEAKTPHAKELAVIVLARIGAIANGARVHVASEQDVRLMIEFAKQNPVEDVN